MSYIIWDFVCTLTQIRHPWRTQCHACNDRLKPVRIPLSAVKWFDRINRSLHEWYCVRQGWRFFSSNCKKKKKYSVDIGERLRLKSVSRIVFASLSIRHWCSIMCVIMICRAGVYLYVNCVTKIIKLIGFHQIDFQDSCIYEYFWSLALFILILHTLHV